MRTGLSSDDLIGTAHGCGIVAVISLGLIVGTSIAVVRGRGWVASLTATAVWLSAGAVLHVAMKSYVARRLRDIKVDLMRAEEGDRDALSRAAERVRSLRAATFDRRILAEVNEKLARLGAHLDE